MESVRTAGFPLAGAVDLAPAAPALAEHVARYDRWLASGFAGGMEYLVRGRARRADPGLVLPGARSVVCVGMPYDPRALGSPGGPRYARYLRGIDYHRDLGSRLDRALESARMRLLAAGEPGFEWKSCVDTSAVLERSWAALAGLGWIGKNTLLIHPKLGSYFFLAEALLDVELGRRPTPMPDLCGHCDRCQTACPTSAFPEPRSLDSNRCISYRTLEKRGPFGLAAAERGENGTWIAGCDVCQEVCPFNFKAAREATERGDRLEDGQYLAGWLELLDESEDRYRARVHESALRRVKPGQFSRNLALAFGNALAQMHEPERMALTPEAGIRIQRRLEAETDPDNRALWEACLAQLDGYSANRIP